MEHKGLDRWRWNVKTALAGAISLSRRLRPAATCARGSRQPLILGYHRVVDDFEAAVRTQMPGMLTSRTMLEKHLDFVGRHFRFVSVAEIEAHFESGMPFTEPVAAVTFDDGYRDVYEQALPVLLRKGIPAALFVVTDLVGRTDWLVHDKLHRLLVDAFDSWAHRRRGLCDLLTRAGLPAEALLSARSAASSPAESVSILLPQLSRAEVDRLMAALEAHGADAGDDVPQTLTWPMLSEMQQAGMTIGSHTCRHISLPTESDATVDEELEGSKRALECELGTTVSHFAYPGGRYSSRDVHALARAGYRCAYTACSHAASPRAPLTLDRLLLWEGSSVDGDGRFSPALLECQTHDLWPPVRRRSRVHLTPAWKPESAQAAASRSPSVAGERV